MKGAESTVSRQDAGGNIEMLMGFHAVLGAVRGTASVINVGPLKVANQMGAVCPQLKRRCPTLSKLIIHDSLVLFHRRESSSAPFSGRHLHTSKDHHPPMFYCQGGGCWHE